MAAGAGMVDLVLVGWLAGRLGAFGAVVVLELLSLELLRSRWPGGKIGVEGRPDILYVYAVFLYTRRGFASRPTVSLAALA